LKEKFQADFSQRFCTLRDAMGMNNVQLGKAVALSHVTIGNYANGQYPKAEHLISLAKIFGVSIDFLLTGERKVTQSAFQEEPPPYKVEATSRALDQVSAMENQLMTLRKTLESMQK
jgi:transcriptional regulator with XRE-family HTH domain